METYICIKSFMSKKGRMFYKPEKISQDQYDQLEDYEKTNFEKVS